MIKLSIAMLEAINNVAGCGPKSSSITITIPIVMCGLFHDALRLQCQKLCLIAILISLPIAQHGPKLPSVTIVT